MSWLELSQVPEHGGEGWEFGSTLWCGTIKKSSNGRKGQMSAYWNLLLQVCSGDQILHIRAYDGSAAFVGCSTAASNGYRTTKRPPETGIHSHSPDFFRVDLQDYSAFDRPIPVTEFFSKNASELQAYYERNRQRQPPKLLFFNKQNGRLGGQFGAYLSEFDFELQRLLIRCGAPSSESELGPLKPNEVATGTRQAVVAQRIGQRPFAARVKDNWGNRCCFPGCDTADSRFLVASHIARWADEPNLRGRIDNGLCLCIAHDRLFESGLFSLDDSLAVVATPHTKSIDSIGWLGADLPQRFGTRLATTATSPSAEAILSHRKRVGLSPQA